MSLTVYSCILLVAADLKIEIFSNSWRRVATASLDVTLQFDMYEYIYIYRFRVLDRKFAKTGR